MKGNEKSNAEIENFFVISSISSKNYPVETVEVILSSLSDGKIYTKELVRNRKYLRFKSYDDLENSLEVRPDLFKKNDYVIVLENNKSFLEIYMEIFGEGNEINKPFIEYWRIYFSIIFMIMI